jgi:di/tricarboxylate transporter
MTAPAWTTLALLIAMFVLLVWNRLPIWLVFALLMFSVAVSLATSLGVSFLPFAMILMSGASSAFINPAGFQTNLMVQKPGGYVFSDFAKVGIPLTLIVGVVVLVLAPIVYGF